MKVRTVPKITVGVAALIALIFIGFVGVRQMNAPTVEERVYLSPWEDGTPRPRNNSEGLAAPTNSTQDIESRDNQSQIGAAEMEPIDDFFSHPQETDTTQFAADVESETDANQDLFAEISTSLDDKGRFPEDVMNDYLEAYRNVDANTMRSLLIGAAKEEFENGMMPVWNGNGELSQEVVDFVYRVVPREDVEVADEILQELRESRLPRIKQSNAQAEIASSEHVGDEFHFRIRLQVPKMRKTPGIEMPELPDSVTPIRKMRKENGLWRIYYRQ